MLIKKVVKYILLFSLFIMLLVTSDLIFFYRNQTYTIAKTGLFFTGYFLDKNDLENAFRTLNFAANLYINKNKTYFPYLDKEYTAIHNLTGIDPQTRNQIKKMLSEKLKETKNYAYPEIVANLIYHIGLIMHNNKYPRVGNLYFITAINLTPKVGSLYLELANAHLLLNEKNQALKILSDCQRAIENDKNCELFLKQYKTDSLLQKAGWLKGFVDKYHLEKVRNEQFN